MLNERSNISKDLAFKHLAIFKKTYDWGTGVNGNGVSERAYMASCVTLMSPSRVPAGDQYNVIDMYIS